MNWRKMLGLVLSLGMLLVMLGQTQSVEAAACWDTGNLVIVLDPGHGGRDGGAQSSHSGCFFQEKDLNLAIALACKAELEQYKGVTVYLTRDTDTYVGLEDRVAIAKNYNADLFVSIHNNSNRNTGLHGAEVYYANSSYNLRCHTIGGGVATQIYNRLVGLGLNPGGVLTRNSEDGNHYADGSIADYYSVIRNSKRAGIPGMIVEHAYISNATDALTYLSTASMLTALGQADADGIAAYYGLMKEESTSSISVSYRSHIQDYGWMGETADSGVCGAAASGLRMEAVRMQISGDDNLSISYRAHLEDKGWLPWTKDAKYSGTMGESKRLEALEIKLTGQDASAYDVYYRVYVQGYGWLAWAKNGEAAGTEGMSLRLEAFQVLVVAKGTDPGSPGGESASEWQFITSNEKKMDDIRQTRYNHYNEWMKHIGNS